MKMHDNRDRGSFITNLNNMLYKIYCCKKESTAEVAVKIEIKEELRSSLSRQHLFNHQKPKPKPVPSISSSDSDQSKENGTIEGPRSAYTSLLK